jgi:hypothetical protein
MTIVAGPGYPWHSLFVQLLLKSFHQNDVGTVERPKALIEVVVK